ncbi:MAG: 4-hydroxy-tetrahydrodipicolinate reductase [Balneolales bacterium]
MKIALLGYGNMGQRIHALAEENGYIVPIILTDENNVNGNGIIPSEFEEIDVAIDFSHPDVVAIHMQKLLELGTPLVIGTTGWPIDPVALNATCKEHHGQVIYGSNFSLGVQLFIKLIARAGELFGKGDFFDVVLNETHHTKKVDAPSGTALTMADVWLKASGSKKETVFQLPNKHAIDTENLLITSQRLGSVFGDHQLRINSPYDEIELTHRARSRDAFAAGAIKAAEWLIEQKDGFYLIEDVIEEVMKA